MIPKNSIGKAYLLFLSNITNFKGRTRRSDFWPVYLINSVILLIVSTISSVFSENMALQGIVMMFGIVISALDISLVVRRLHDIGKAGVLYLVILIPLIGTILLFVWCAKDSQLETNKYGDNPKYIQQNQECQQIPSVKHCSVCNYEITNNAEFCPQCGSRLEGENCCE